MTEELCNNCGCPIHPCLPCGEIIAFHNHVDSEYFRLIKSVLEKGRLKKNRTGIDTIGIFGAQAKFDINLNSFPILTTKKVFFKGILHELLWFIKGDTNIKYLVDNNVHIWDEWAYAKYKKVVGGPGVGECVQNGFTKETMPTQEAFIQRIKNDPLFAKQWGELGEGTYGGMWRAFPYYFEQPEYEYGSPTGSIEAKLGTVDQLKKVVDKLKTNPTDRRMIVSAWHPYWVDHCALPPCHCLFHFNTEELTLEERQALLTNEQYQKVCSVAIDAYDKQGTFADEMTKIGIPTRRLNCLLYQRSCDAFLGVPFNITSYCLLTAMMAHCVNMLPGVFTHTYGDLHIYQNHINQVNLQLERTPKLLPSLWINPDVRDLFSLKFDDIRLENYQSHPAIKGEVAV